MIRTIICIGILSFSVFSTPDIGQHAYLNQQFDRAIDAYKNKLQNSPNDPIILYNLGASYYQNNQLALSKTYFLKALKERPNQADTKHNIHLINQTFIDQQLFFDDHWFHLFGLTPTGLSNVILLLLIPITLWVIPSKRRPKKQPIFMGILLSMGMLIGLLCWCTLLTINQPLYGLVTSQKLQVYSGPSQTLRPLFFAHKF